jgi:hypothetical protein
VHGLFGHAEYSGDLGPGPAGYSGAAYHRRFQATGGAAQLGGRAQRCPRILIASRQCEFGHLLHLHISSNLVNLD